MPITVGAPFLLNIVIQEGADCTYALRWLTGVLPGTPVNLTGYSAKCEFRSSVGGVTWIALTNGAGITLDASGNVTITMTNAQTSTFTGYTDGVWSIELTSSSGVVTRLAQGTATVSHDVTR